MVLVGQPQQDRLVDRWITDTRNELFLAGLDVLPVVVSREVPRTVCVIERVG